MKRVFFGLCAFSLFLFSYPATLLADAPPAAPLTPSPESGASYVALPLLLNWEDVPEAQSYRYEFIGYQEDGEPKEFLVTQSQSDPLSPEVLKFLGPQPSSSQKRLWHAKSCEDAEGTTCGPWGDVWDFTYLPGPAVLKSPAVNAINVSLPVTLDWDDVSGAGSYILFLNKCPSWFKEDGKCMELPAQSSKYTDDTCSFTRNTNYTWQVASCLDTASAVCGPYSKESSFQTTSSPLPFSIPTSLEPKVEHNKPLPRVSQSTTLSWSGSACGSFYRVRFTRDDGAQTEFFTPLEQTESVRMSGDEKDEEGNSIEIQKLKDFWGNANNLNRTFNWTVTPCWKTPILGTPDCTNTTESAQAQFQTAGALPTLSQPADGSSTKIPILLSWQGDGASYRYQIAKDTGFAQIAKEGVAQGTSVEIVYTPPDIISGTSYWWHVKTCVDETGEVCGSWSNVFQFTTFPLDAPSIPNPSSGGNMFLVDAVTWNSVPGANAYQYRLGYACRDEKETLKNCVAYNTNVCPDTNATKTVENAKIVSSNSFNLPYCMGKYTWAVRSCLDRDCTITKPSTLEGAGYQTLTAIQPPPSGAGLVPCGKLSNEPATPYNEVEPCQLKHAGFLFQNLLDFILWKVSLFILLILAVIAGATSYFSPGGPNALARIKTVFRSFFVGFLILMFAWMLVNIVLMLFGFQFEFFGKWWEVSF